MHSSARSSAGSLHELLRALTFLPRNGIVLAPLAGGPSTPELAAAVSNAGALGFLGAGYLTAEALAAQVRRTRALTGQPIGVNLFRLVPAAVDEAAIARYARELEPEARARGVELGRPHFDDDGYDAKLAVALAAGVEVVSFTFGCPTADEVASVHAHGSSAWVTVTSAAEARAAVFARADAVVAQGAEAGGHRGAWSDDDGPDRPLLELVAELVPVLEVPVVAAGGIADGDGVRAALAAGACAVQVGTSFLLCPEAGTSVAQRAAIAAGGETAMTRAFTGRRARGIVNAFMRAHPDAPSAYPHVHHLTAPLRTAAREAGDADGFNLWAGVSVSRATPLPAAEVVASLLG
jgi:nitronate monooxygenase